MEDALQAPWLWLTDSWRLPVSPHSEPLFCNKYLLVLERKFENKLNLNGEKHLRTMIDIFLFCLPLSILSFQLPRVRSHRALHGPQAAAAYHRREEGLDQRAGAFPQAPAAELPGP